MSRGLGDVYKRQFISRVGYGAVKIYCRSVIVAAVEIFFVAALGFNRVFETGGTGVSSGVGIRIFFRVALAFFITGFIIFSTG